MIDERREPRLIPSNLLIWDGVEPTEDEWLQLELTVPVFQVKLFDREPFQVHRCESDGGIVTDCEKSIEQHLGHRMRQPVLLKREEVYALIKGIIPS